MKLMSRSLSVARNRSPALIPQGRNSTKSKLLTTLRYVSADQASVISRMIKWLCNLSNYNMLTMYSQEIRSDALKLRGSYTTVGGLAIAYIQISEKHIFPGVLQVNRLMSSSSLQASSQFSIADKIEQINSYARKAQSEASRIADQRRKAIQDQLYDKKRIIDEAGAILENYELEGADNEEDEEGGGLKGKRSRKNVMSGLTTMGQMISMGQ